MTNEFERIQKESVMAKLWYSPGIYLEGLRETTKLLVRIVSVPAGI
jgi:hypothetical protein